METIAQKYWRERAEKESQPIVKPEGEVYNEKGWRICQQCGGEVYIARVEDGSTVHRLWACRNDSEEKPQHVIGGMVEIECWTARWTPVSGVRYAVSHEEKENPWEGATPQSVE